MNKEDNFKEKFKQALISTAKVISDDYKPNANKQNASSNNFNFFELKFLRSPFSILKSSDITFTVEIKASLNFSLKLSSLFIYI